MDAQAYLDLLDARFSVRSFTDEQLTREDLAPILESARMSPSAKNMQPYRLCIVQSEEGLAKIDECTKCRYNAPTVIICAFDKTVSVKGLGFEGNDFGYIDTSIVMTNMANTATAAGLGSCFVGAYDSDAIRERFDVPDDYVLVDLLMLGHPAPDAAPTERHILRAPLEQTATHESF